MKNLFICLFVFMVLAKIVYSQTYEKIDDSTLKIIESKETSVNINNLLEQRSYLISQLIALDRQYAADRKSLKDRYDLIEAKLLAAKTVGIIYPKPTDSINWDDTKLLK